MSEAKRSNFVKELIPKFSKKLHHDHENAGAVEHAVMSVRWSPNGQQLAASLGDGEVKVIDIDSGHVIRSMAQGSGHHCAVSCVRWGLSSEDHSVLIVGRTDGTVAGWNSASNSIVWEVKEDNNEIYAVDHSYDGLQFATAGKDRIIRIYDASNHRLVRKLSGSGLINPVHKSRIFSLKYSFMHSCLVSGGWDHTVQVWDPRVDTDGSVRIFHEDVFVSGDSVDVWNNDVTVGSWRRDKNLLMFDLGSGNLIRDISFDISEDDEPATIYCAQFTKHNNGANVVAGSSGNNMVRIVESASGKAVAAVSRLPHAVLSCHTHPVRSMFAFGSADGTAHIVDYSNIDS